MISNLNYFVCDLSVCTSSQFATLFAEVDLCSSCGVDRQHLRTANEQLCMIFFFEFVLVAFPCVVGDLGVSWLNLWC